MSHFLQQPIETLRMVGPEYAQRLHKLDIFTINDLLHHYPFHHEDRSQITPLDKMEVGETVTITGTIIAITNTRTRTGKTMQKAIFADDSGQIEVTWFNQPFLVKAFQKNPDVSLSGTISAYRGNPTLTSPQYEYHSDKNPKSTKQIHTGRLVPRYHQTAGVTSKWLRSRINALLRNTPEIPDPLPENILQDQKLLDLKTALNHIHFPPDYQALEKARSRLEFDELFYLQLTVQTRKYRWQQKTDAHSFEIKPENSRSITDSLPFKLTKAQQSSLEEILEDLKKDKPMNRLLQGDVGSGKTVVAAIAMYHAVKNNLTTVLMAPTEVLALQHAKTITQLLEPLGITISVQTRSQKDDVKDAQVYIGTHALLHREIDQNIGLLVIDEQHRFGVEQRSQLLKQKHTPHLLSMTATPIPRTIALTLYADLDVSVIDELPPGRKPVKTWLVPPKKRSGAYAWMKDQIDQTKTQVFVVCPLIEDSETPMLDQVKAAQSEYEHLKDSIFPDYKLGLLHGRQKSKEKNQMIKQFRDHQLDLLVATPVIEVGIDIPNANIILIEAAERFGLASLHQLRGRVGRGGEQAYCLLFTSSGKNSSRLKHLENTHSGFELAQIDLKLRGAGEIYGTKQSGHINLKIASLSDQILITTTNRLAQILINHDPHLTKHPLLESTIKSLLEKDIQPN